MADAVIGSTPVDEQLTPAGRRAIWGAFLGLAVDFYDIYLPVVALTPALIYFFPKNLPVSTQATLNFIVFAVALIGRPIGAFIFGHLGDVIGRRRTTLIAVGGFASMTFLIGLLPGYATLGYGAIALLILARLVDGVFMGGEYTSANPLAMEACPKRLRGFVGGFIQAAYPVAYIAISITVILMLGLLSSKGLNSPYVQWGWRIPFFFGGLLGVAFLFYYVRVKESTAWEVAKSKGEATKAPLKQLFAGQNFRNLAQVFILMTGMWLAVQAVISAMPVLLITVLKQPAASVTRGLLISNVFLTIGYIVVALLGQKYGRRLMLIVSGFWTLILGTICYYLVIANVLSKGSFVLTIVFATITLTLTIAPWGIVTSYINERFPTGVRASGFGIGYSLAVIIPSFYSFFLLGLAKLMPYQYTVLVLLVLAGAFQIVGAWMGPETRDVDLASLVAPGTKPTSPSVAPA
jgi:MFS family permease